MHERIEELRKEAEKFIANSSEELEEFRIKILSKKGRLNQLFEDFKSVSPELKKEMGQKLNHLKNSITERFEHLRKGIENKDDEYSEEDFTRPGAALKLGSRHPVSLMVQEIKDIFAKLGFTVANGPEIEDDWHVFSALNFPPEHPARDMQDTFFISKNPDILLRTHTSSIQVRTMEKEKPPIRVICPGRVFRNEAVSARSHCIFHQVEGLYIDENVSFADMKQTLLFFAKEMFGENTKIRLRPSFFPFTEPSAEMDVSCTCNGKGCNLCKYTGWLEVMGCGMVHSNVLENCNIDSKKYSGYAFGMGVERLAMLKYNIKDIRLYFENDVRFLSQFLS